VQRLTVGAWAFSRPIRERLQVVAEGEAGEILRALEEADERRGAAERRARTYLVARGVLDHANRDLRLLVLEVASEDQGAGK